MLLPSLPHLQLHPTSLFGYALWLTWGLHKYYFSYDPRKFFEFSSECSFWKLAWVIFFKVFRWDFLNNVWNRWKMKENLLIVCLFRLLCFWEYRIPSDSRYWLIHGRNQSTLLNFICLQSFIHVSACIAWNKMVLSYLPLATRSNHDVWYLIIDCLLIWSSNFRLEKLLHAKEPAYPASGDLLSAVSDIWDPFLIEQYHRCIGETEGPSLSMTDVLHLSVSCHFLKNFVDEGRHMCKLRMRIIN